MRTVELFLGEPREAREMDAEGGHANTEAAIGNRRRQW